MSLAREGLDRALRGILAGPTYLALASRVDGDMVVEVSDEGYARQSITFDDPVDAGDGVRACASKDPILFPPWVKDAPAPIRYFFISDSPVIGDGSIIVIEQIAPSSTDPAPTWDAPVAGQPMWFGAGGVRVTMK